MNELIVRTEIAARVYSKWYLSRLDIRNHNCGMFAAEVAKELSGVKYATGIIKKGVSGKRVEAFLARSGGAEAYLSSQFKEIHPLEALPCDILLFPSPHEKLPSLGVALGNGQAAAFAEREGEAPIMVAAPAMSDAIKAWRVEWKQQ